MHRGIFVLIFFTRLRLAFIFSSQVSTFMNAVKCPKVF